jgi:hypothetical protein
MKNWINRSFIRITALIFISVLAMKSTNAQFVFSNDSAFRAGQENTGRLWGYAFGDFAYKGHADSLSRGNANQYTGIPAHRDEFAFRRIYLGYDYNINKKFSASLLLAAEDNFPAGSPPANGTFVLNANGSSTGDLTLNNKLTFYIKQMFLRWKGIWKGTDLLVGQFNTPSFPDMSEKIWAYRPIERTIIDIRRTGSYDLGVGLQGVFDPETKNFGYDILIGNGTGDRPDNTPYKWFYGDVYAYFGHKHFVVDLYADYQKLNWTPQWHHSRQMFKAFAAWNSSATDKSMNPGTGYTIGVEGYVNNLFNDNFAPKIAGGADTLSTAPNGISFFVHGDIIKNKLRFFARWDLYNPNNLVNKSVYKSYSGNTGNYNDNSFHTVYSTNAGGQSQVTYTSTGDQTYKQQFITAGLDWKPVARIHFMPNVWYNSYSSQIASNKDYDLVWRITFFFSFGKNYDNGGF